MSNWCGNPEAGAWGRGAWFDAFRVDAVTRTRLLPFREHLNSPTP